MRRVELCGLLAAIIVASTALAADAAPKAPKQEPEKYLPIHAVLSVRGTAIPQRGRARARGGGQILGGAFEGRH